MSSQSQDRYVGYCTIIIEMGVARSIKIGDQHSGITIDAALMLKVRLETGHGCIRVNLLL